MVIDIHCHPVEQWEGVEGCNAVADIARRAGIDWQVLLGVVGRYGAYPTEENIQASNNVTMNHMRWRPDHYLGFCYLNPQHDPGFSRDELLRCLAEGMRGIKLWIAVKATDPRLDAIMNLAAEFDLPVLHHSWYKTVQAYEDESNPAEIADLARRHPTVPLIMAHLTGGMHRGVTDVIDLPNVYVDTSGSQPVTGIIEYAVQELGAHRLLFGSDICGRDFSVALARVEGANISTRERRLILGENARRLLKLGQEA